MTKSSFLPLLFLLVANTCGIVVRDDEPKYVFLASQILRPSSIYKVIAMSFGDGSDTVVKASVSRQGAVLAYNEAPLGSYDVSHVLLRIPSDNSNGTAEYKLRIEGHGPGGGMVYEEERPLKFSGDFLSITISTNKVVFNAEQTIRIRVVMLTHYMKPYEGIVDLFLLDPDGYVVRKWNSQELNVGVLIQTFELPLYPKVGFWTIRVKAETQTEELKVKVEKHYLPMYELVVTAPAFVVDTEKHIEVTVDAAFVTERIAKGNITLNWYAKKIDGLTPMYNDTVWYREKYRFVNEMANVYRNAYFPLTNNSQAQLTGSLFFNSFTNSTFGPVLPFENEWVHIKSDFRLLEWPGGGEAFWLFLAELEHIMGTSVDIQVRAEAALTEYFYNKTEVAFAETRIIHIKPKLQFLGDSPYIFKPGMTFEGQISVSYDDYVAIEPDVLAEGEIRIRVFVKLENGQQLELEEIVVKEVELDEDAYIDDDVDTEELFEIFMQVDRIQEFKRQGVYSFQVIDIPEDAVELKMEAEFEHEDHQNPTAQLYAVASKSKVKKYIKVLSSTNKVEVGKYAVFHVKTSFPVDAVYWIIMSKDVIVLNGKEVGGDIHPEVITFSVVVSPEMSPSFILIAMVFQDSEVITDTLFMPVDAISSGNLHFGTTQIKDHNQLTMEATLKGTPGSVILVSTMRELMFPIQGSNLLSKANIMNSLYAMGDKEAQFYHKTFRTSRDGQDPDDVLIFRSGDLEPEPLLSLRSRNVLIMSNFVDLIPDHNCTGSQIPCLLSGCFEPGDKCNGVKDCIDGVDERGCIDEETVVRDEHQRFRLSRRSRFEDFYDVGDGDWGWIETNVDHDGEQFVTLELPETPDDFIFHVFSISKEHGISLLHPPSMYSTIRPFDFYCEGPPTLRSGENVGILCTLLNRSNREVEAVVILKGSEDYSFINVEEFGYVTSYAPRLTQGDHHHFLWLRPESELELRLPVAPHMHQGQLVVTIEISTQITSQTREVEIEIVPEGSTVYRHTSVLLDLKNRANVLRFMNIIVDETPIIPYEVFRRYIYGSAAGHVSLCGDVMGPVFPDDEPVTYESMFSQGGHGRFGKGSLYHAFNLGANVWQLHYLRLTNQFSQRLDAAKAVFKAMNVEYTAVLRRFSAHGFWTNWDQSPPSVWLTAWIIRILCHTSFQDWEDFIYIDREVIRSGVLWLLNYQTQDGAFLETIEYRHDGFHPSLLHVNSSVPDAALTAHVLMALEESAFMLQGGSKQYSASARQRAGAFLERRLLQMEDVYDIAVSAYALTLAKSPQLDVAYSKLLAKSREEGGMVYWSRSPIHTNRVRYEFNRPFLEAKDRQVDDAMAVEVTAYALLTIFQVEGGGVTFTQEKVVEWLNSMRLADGGFVAAVDTIIALQALTVYSYNNRIKDITDLYVNVELPDSNLTDRVHIHPENMALTHRIDIPNVWGHVNIFAEGAGQAVAQLNLKYGIDFEPFKDTPAKDAFRLTITEYFGGRNKSEVTIKSCFSWVLTDISRASGPAMLEVDTPSGYILEQYEANSIVRSGAVPEMTDADTLQPGRTIWYFDRIPNVTRCFQHTVKRYFPVSNMTRTRQAVILETHRPEFFFVRTFNATSLYILSICEVCGSYQCPYCPFFSSAPVLGVSPSGLFIVFMLISLI